MARLTTMPTLAWRFHRSATVAILGTRVAPAHATRARCPSTHATRHAASHMLPVQQCHYDYVPISCSQIPHRSLCTLWRRTRIPERRFLVIAVHVAAILIMYRAHRCGLRCSLCAPLVVMRSAAHYALRSSLCTPLLIMRSARYALRSSLCAPLVVMRSAAHYALRSLCASLVVMHSAAHYALSCSLCAPFVMRSAAHYALRCSLCAPLVMHSAAHYALRSSLCAPFVMRSAPHYALRSSFVIMRARSAPHYAPRSICHNAHYVDVKRIMSKHYVQALCGSLCAWLITYIM